MGNHLIGQHPEACLVSRIGDVLGGVFIRSQELAGLRGPSDRPVDPLIDSLAHQVLGRVIE